MMTVSAPNSRINLSQAPDIAVVGSFSYDHLRNPYYGEHTTVGGAGAFLSLAAAVAGSRVGVVGILPKHVNLNTLARVQGEIDLTGLLRRPDVDIAFDIEYDGEWNATYHVDNATAEDTLSFQDFPHIYRSARGVHLCPLGGVGTQLEFVQAIRSNMGAILSATTHKGHVLREPDLLSSLVQQVDVFFLNQEEALLLTSQSQVDLAFTSLEAWARQTLICVTQGKVGVTLLDRGHRYTIDAHPTVVKDPTGAGEAFAGAFMATYLVQRDPVVSGVVGTCVASITIEEWGLDGLLQATQNTVQQCVSATKQI
jgi:sugar/nucleoside kinase (ribokinase family)